jgi:hypothetical protein
MTNPVVDFIARFITDDPCIFNEEQMPTPSASSAPSNADINAANKDIIGLQGRAEEELKADVKDKAAQEANEEAKRAKKLDPLFKQANEELQDAVKMVDQAYGNSANQHENLKMSQGNLDKLKNMIAMLGKVAARG